MNTFDNAFKNKPLFMPYYPLGFPDLETSIEVIKALAEHGADLIEVGLSFSDPLADGPIIQQATQTALEKGITIKKSIQAVNELRMQGVTIPLVMMGYYNPILAFGLQEFITETRVAGINGFIIPDLPSEEAMEFESLSGDLPLIRMVAPNTPSERMEKIVRRAEGFVYLVSLTGVTGIRKRLADGLRGLIANVREHTTLPVCVGFGISTPQQAQEVGKLADGIIIGSACVKAIGGSDNPVEAAKRFAAGFRRALN